MCCVIRVLSQSLKARSQLGVSAEWLFIYFSISFIFGGVVVVASIESAKSLCPRGSTGDTNVTKNRKLVGSDIGESTQFFVVLCSSVAESARVRESKTQMSVGELRRGVRNPMRDKRKLKAWTGGRRDEATLETTGRPDTAAI